MQGRYAISWEGSWWILAAPVGQIGIAGKLAGWYVRRLNTETPPVTIRVGMLAQNAVLLDGGLEYDSIRPVLWSDGPEGGDPDPLQAGLVDDSSLGAYVGEPRMLAQAPKRTKGKR